MAKIPEKLFFKIGEVCELTQTQPYVLRFWESEFPQLAPKKNRSGQRIYSSEDIEVVEEIKRLLYEDGFTIAGARKQLELEGVRDTTPKAKPKKPEAAAAKKSTKKPAKKAAKKAAAATRAAIAHDLQADGDEHTLDELRAILEIMDETDRRLR
jgi:DNA-binding transcriptional MerR regulator